MNRGGVSADAGGRPGFAPRASTLKESKHVHVSRTLYVTNIAPGTRNEDLEKLFCGLEGFIAMRRVRSMCFVDFDEKQHATSAIWRTNGHKFKPSDEGILVSYDKDDSEERGGWSMRKKEEEKRKKQEIDATRILYKCTACNHTCLRLARPLSEMPERKTDGSRVVDAANDLVYLAVVKGGVKLIKREKGVEKQWRYNCELCDVVVGYRPVDYNAETKYVYIFPEAIRTNKPGVPNNATTTFLREAPPILQKGILGSNGFSAEQLPSAVHSLPNAVEKDWEGDNSLERSQGTAAGEAASTSPIPCNEVSTTTHPPELMSCSGARVGHDSRRLPLEYSTLLDIDHQKLLQDSGQRDTD